MKPVLVLCATLSIAALSGCSSVQTQQISDEPQKEVFVLSAFFHEPPQTLSSHALSSEAEKVCPKGYDVLLRDAYKRSEFAKDHFQCVSPGGCEYQLDWRIQCSEKPEKKFSIFGKF